MRSEKINQFKYKGISSADMGIIITQSPNIESAERDEEYISVPGKSGDVINDNGRFKNITVSYEAALLSDDRPLDLMARKIKAWLQGETGYFKLTDTYDPNYFRMAAYSGSIDIEDKIRKIGITTLNFNCKPFKYRIDGENDIEITKATTLYNPEEWESLPYIKIVGSGAVTLHINNNSFYISAIDDYIEINSELQSAYKSNTLQNSKINFATFPTLSAGTNNISWVGSVSKIIIKARWCCI